MQFLLKKTQASKHLEWCHMQVEHVMMPKESMHQLKESAMQQPGEQKYYHYLFGGSFKLVTDHKPLMPLLNNPQKKSAVRIERMRIKIMGYDYQAEYRPGKDDPADWSSGPPLKEEPPEEEELEHLVNLLTHAEINPAIPIEEIKKRTAESDMMHKIIKMIQVGQRNIKDPALEPFKFVFPKLTVVDGLVLRGERVVVPNTLQERIVNIAHEGHFGITKAKNLSGSRVWFPKMVKITEEVVRKVRIVHSTSTKAATPKLEEIFSEFGYPEEEFKSDNGSPLTQLKLKITVRVINFIQSQLHQKSQKQMEHLKAS